MYPETFEKLINSLRKLPGVGSKSAERYAFHLLELSEQEIDEFIKSLQDMKLKLKKCSRCGNLAEEDLCEVCKDTSRDINTICIVQSAKDVIAIEKMNSYTGVYHVLHGVISTSKGVMPNDINIDSLIARINDSTKEVIIAINPTIEGETTALYLSKLLQKYNIEVTRLAHGLPMGGHLDYADELTLMKAMEGRSKF